LGDNRGVYPAVFFDRDGVLVQAPVRNGIPTSARTVDELEFVPEMVQLTKFLSARGIRTFVVTNQPDLARGLLRQDQLEAQNSLLRRHLDLTDIAVCPHDDSEDCECRKPRPGLVLELSARHSIDLENSILVGDRWRDVDAGNCAKVKTIFIDYGYSESLRSKPTWHTRSPLEAAGVVQEWAETLAKLGT